MVDLKGCMICTPYPRITAEFLENAGVNALIQFRQGKIEGLWQLYPNNKAVVDVANSGATCEANQIIRKWTIMKPEVVFVQSPAMSRRDQKRVADLQNKLYLAAQRNK
ncbi:MAG: hypothetical protein M1514_02280 [Patescibacteria group bacterium]|nr:hypothetical protein [Patescibacteria group bacterium]